MRLLVLAGIFAALGVFCLVIPFHVAMTGLCFLALAAVCGLLWLLRGKKHERMWRVILLSLTGACMLAVFAAMLYIDRQGKSDSFENDAAPEFVVVLGAQVQGDRPSLTLKKRLDLAAEYLAQHPQAAVVVSGGQGADEQYTEASVMAAYLVRQGIGASRIMQEDKASDTRENLAFSRALVKAHGIDTERVLIITSDYHLCRAKFLAEKLGMQAYGLASQTWPEILRVNYLLREVFAFVKAALLSP